VSVRPERVRLIDGTDNAGRTTATLVASLAARLGTLYLVSGTDAVGSLAAGYCALGRGVGRTAEGARLRRALESGRAGANGDAIWKTLLIDSWVSSAPPSPILDQLRNDVALLLADDIVETLELMPIPSEPAGEGAPPLGEWTFSELVLGLWAFSREVVAAIEALAEPTLPPPGEVREGASPGDPPAGELLR
jgi:hypothetical protein